MATLKNLTVNDTGFIKLPSGSNAQRPGSPTAGMMRYNTDLSRNEVYDGAGWVLLEGSASAAGGSVTTAGGYKIHTFTSGSTTFTMNFPGTVEILAIGGGGGGAGIGGGGGAGGYIYESGAELPAGNYTITVGGGGQGETSHNAQNQNPGGPSSIVGPGIPQFYNAIGGGRGCSYTSTNSNPIRAAGGSGGGGPGGHIPGDLGNGGWYPQAPGGHGNQGTDHPYLAGTPNATLQGLSTGNNYDHISMEGNGHGNGIVGQGHPGGHGAHGGGFGWAAGSVVMHCGGGGGGAGAAGKNQSSSNEYAAGGAGLASQISGTVTRYAGGGGGGTHVPGNPGHYGLNGAYAPPVGAQNYGGGLGGSPGTSGGTGGTNTGGGGGGGQHNSNDVSGPGGPGIVIVRYRDT
jgi:hypothetical protein